MPAPNEMATQAFDPSSPGAALSLQLRQLWERGERPDLRALIAAASDPTPRDIAAAIDVDQWHRWQRGERVPAEEYLHAFPVLLSDSESCVQVVYGEYVLREQRGEKPNAEEFVGRFPQWAERLRQQFELRQALGVQTIESRQPIPNSPLSETIPAPASAAVAAMPSHWPVVEGYEILGELGKGGMGIVYQARQQGLNRLVALKMIRGGAHLDDQWKARFIAEAEAVAKFQHPNIVQIYQIGTQDGLPFFSLEYVDGGSLDKHLARQPQSPAAAAEMIETLARAMNYAHRQGVVHRDLKPANVLLQTTRAERASQQVTSSIPLVPSVPFTLKITDFGLAKQLDTATHLTQTGAIVGTPIYMAPEQVRADPRLIGPATDIYSLGVILYEMLAGRPPFLGATPHEVFRQVTDADPLPPSRLVGGTPRDLETICLKCLRKEPEKRYTDAGALADDLHRFRAGEPIQARPIGAWERTAKWAKRRPTAAALIVVSTLAAAVLMVTLILSNVLLSEKQRETNEALTQRTEALNALTDQQKKTHQALQLERRTSYRQRIGQFGLEWDANHADRAMELLDACPTDLRDWEWHFLRRSHRAGQMVWLADENGVQCVDYSPDGRLLAIGGGDQYQTKQANNLSLVTAATGMTDVTLSGLTGPITGVSFSPNGKLVAAVTARADWERLIGGDIGADNRVAGDLKAWDVTTHQEVQSIPDMCSDVKFSPDGKHLAAVGSDGCVRIWDTTTTPAWTEVKRLPAYPGRIATLAYSPDGKHLATGGTFGIAVENGQPKYRSDITVYDTATGRQEHTWQWSDREIHQIAFSRDGRQVAVAHGRGVGMWNWTSEEPPVDLEGYGNSLACLAFSRDGRRLASAGSDRVVVVWDTTSGKRLFLMRGELSGINGVAFEPHNGDIPERLVTGSAKGLARVWEVRDPTEPRFLRGHKMAVSAVAFSPVGGRLASREAGGTVRIWDLAAGTSISIDSMGEKLAWSADGTQLLTAGGNHLQPDSPGVVKIWDATTGRELHSLAGHTLYAGVAAWSRDGQRIITASGNPMHKPPRAGEVKIWDANNCQELHSFDPRIGCISAAAFGPDSRLIALASTDGIIRIYDAATLHELRSCVGHKKSVSGVVFSPDGRRLASSDYDGNVFLWDVETGQQAAALIGHTEAVMSLAFNRDGSRLATASFNFLVSTRGEVKIWDTASGNEVLSLPGQFTTDFSRDGRYLAAASQGSPLQPGSIVIWDGTPDPERLTLRQNSIIFGVAVRPEGRQIAVGASDRAITIWDPETRQIIRKLTGHQHNVIDVAYAPDGRTLASSSEDATAKLWDAETGVLLHDLPGHSKFVNSVRFSLDGRQLATSSFDHSVRLWDVATGHGRTLGEHDGAVRELAYFPDGRFLASCGQDRLIRIWDLTVNKESRRLAGHTEPVNCLACSPDGRWLASASGGTEKLIRIWESASGEVRHTLSGHAGSIRAVAFSPDSRRLASAGADRTIRLWDVATGKLIATFDGHVHTVRSLAFAPDGKTLYSGSYDRTVKIWEVP